MERIKGLSEEEALYLRVTLGTQRKLRFFSPFEAAKLLNNGLEAGEKKGDLKSKVGISIDMINKILRLCSIKNNHIKSAITWQSPGPKQISMSSASELSRLKNNEDQIKLFNSILENNFTSKEVKELVTLYGRSGKSIEKCINQIKEAKRKTINTHVIIGSITSSSLREQLSSVPALTRNRILRNVLNTHIPSLKYKGAKLKKTQFMVVGDEKTEMQISLLGDDFEDVITKLLIDKIREE